MQENKVEPRLREGDSADPRSHATVDASKGSGSKPRPIAVYIIACWCVLQYLGILMYLVSYWASFSELMRIGAESPIAFFGKLVYPTVLFAGGVLLFFMRKAALALFGIYFVWGVTKVISQHVAFPGYLSLALVLGIVIYSYRLHQQGRLT